MPNPPCPPFSYLSWGLVSQWGGDIQQENHSLHAVMEQGAFICLTCCLGLKPPRLICCESLCLGWITPSDSRHCFCSHMWWWHVNRKKTEVFPNHKNGCSDEVHCWWAGDSQSAGIRCVHTLSVVTVVGLGLVSVEIWESKKCKLLVMAVRMWKREKVKRETKTTRQTPFQFL